MGCFQKNSNAKNRPSAFSSILFRETIHGLLITDTVRGVRKYFPGDFCLLNLPDKHKGMY